jgi:hypothetical protein
VVLVHKDDPMLLVADEMLLLLKPIAVISIVSTPLSARRRGGCSRDSWPGTVWTPLISSTMAADKVKQFGATSLFERPAQPIELARLFVFLASDDASYATGEIFGSTGGRTPL